MWITDQFRLRESAALTRENILPRWLYVLATSFLLGTGVALTLALTGVSQSLNSTLWVPLAGLVVSAACLWAVWESEDLPVALCAYYLGAAAIGLPIGMLMQRFGFSVRPEFAAVPLIVAGVLGVNVAVDPKPFSRFEKLVAAAVTLIVLTGFADVYLPWLGVSPASFTYWGWLGVWLFSAIVITVLWWALNRPRCWENTLECAVFVYVAFLYALFRGFEFFDPGDTKTKDA